jgi:RHS repeat-associated protein
LTIDGSKITTPPFTITPVGGHAVLAVARDLAGNETRAERTLFIGTSAAGNLCQLDSFDPADGSVILSNKTELVGRSGGAIGVKVNGVAAIVADGAFCASVELPVEGANTVNIVCTDANGNPTGTPATITLQRVTGDPSITIVTPVEGFTSATESIAVTGTVGAGVVSADVNGVAATMTGSNFSVPAVRLAGGLNILVAHGRNAGGRVATASRRGLYIKDAPSISISSPAANTTTGLTSITVSGTYANLDPTTIVMSPAAPVQFVRFSDTTGSFVAAGVPLNSGEQTLRVSGHDQLNRSASATVVVKLVAGSPSIVISQPADHAYFGGGSDSVTVTGSYQAAAGSTVDVSGVTAALNGTTYTASVKFSTLAGGITPIVASVTEPGGASASSIVVITQIADAPKVTESFPAANAVEVDSGALLLVLFSQPMDRTTLSAGGFRLEDSSGAPISGTLYVDKDVLTFAPATLLTTGAHYTLRVTTAAKNLAGTPLAAEYTSGFTVATSAPSIAPVLTPLGSSVCGQSIAVNGTSSPGARIRLQSGSLTLNGAADATGKFTFTFPISGQSGFALVRVQTIGSDGSVSPEAELKVRIDCNGPQVLSSAYARSVNQLTITFSEPIDAASATVGNSILLTLPDGRSVAGSAAVAQKVATITPAEDLSAKNFTLTVTTGVKDTIGNRLVTPYTQAFSIGDEQPVAGDGTGFISGEVYDATTGRPLSGVSITIEVASAAPVTTSTDARGRYLARLREGAHTIKAALSGYTSVWRQIIVPAGAGVVPIDIRLTRRGDAKTSDGSAIASTHGGDTTITKKIDLTIPVGVLASGRKVTLTSVGAQALTGLLPLGWSPIASAEIAVDGSEASTPLSGAQLTFTVSAAEINAASQNLTAVQYDSVRDEWRVLVSVVNVGSDGKAIVSVDSSGAYALAYPDKAAGLTAPPLAVAGDVLRGVPAAAADAPALVKRDFVLNPPVILPSGRTVATLRIEGSGKTFPSGTAVQAYIDEDLKLADGSRLLDPPFATDLLLYRTLAGDLGIADFHLAPSAKATEVVLEVGVDHIRILPYPGRLDRGTLIGSEGGRVPADDKVAVEIPTGSVPEPLRATATSLTTSDLNAIGTIAGFRVAGGFQLTLQRATQPAPQDLDGDGQPDAILPVELFVPAKVTFTVDASQLPARTSQVILAELLDQTPYGRMVRLAVPMMPVDSTQSTTPVIRFTTKSIDRSVLPVDGVVHEGRYVLLAAESPIAFATGTVHLLTATGHLLADARVLAPPLGVAELSRQNGIYNIPVPAKPAGPFTLIPRHTSTGDGASYVHSLALDPDAVVRVDLGLAPQPPVLGTVVVLRGDPPSQGNLAIGVTTDVALTTNIRASFTPSIDPSSVRADSIIVTDAVSGAKVNGQATADGTVAVVWTLTTGERLKPNGRYIVSISPSIRGTNGATLGHGASFTFATVTQILNAEVRRERIRITIPDPSGVSHIIGEAGALPAGWQAVAVRRHKDFIVRYQATAAGDGSFSFALGNGDPADRIDLGDLIDLQVISNIGNVSAIFALTPFVTEDGKGFVVPAGAAVKYTTPEGFTLDVPEGAFDEPKVVTVTAVPKQEFLEIPEIETENEYIGSVHIDFEGQAKKPLGFEAPVPAGFDTTGKQFILAQKMLSTRGPRLAVMDILRVENGKFTTARDPNEQNQLVTVMRLDKGTQQTLTGSKFRKYMTALLVGGAYMYLDIRQPVGGSVGWGVMDGMQGGYDLHYNIFFSYFIPYITVVETGGAVLPIITGKPFTVVGVDPGTGLQAFSRTYDPIPFGPPGTVATLDPAQQNDGGPYPVFGSPFRVEMVDLDVEQVDIKTVRNFNVRLDGGVVRVTAGNPALDASTQVEVLNITKGTFTSGSATASMTLEAKAGDRIVLLIEERDVEPSSPISIAFSEVVYTGGSTKPDDIDAFLHTRLKVEWAPEPVTGTPPLFSDITPQVTFTTDSGDRRINVGLPSALQRESVYRVTLQSNITDVVNALPGLGLGQGTVDSGGKLMPVGGGNALHLLFHVRKPAGALGTFTTGPAGLLTGMDLAGNVLFVAAQNSGLLAYDVSNPAALGAGATPLAISPGTYNGGTTDAIAITIDRHNRIYSTGQAGIGGVLRTFRVEDFVNGATVWPRGSSLISWKIGYSQMIGLPSNTVVSDRPESIPFRVKILLQDDEQNFANRDGFVSGTGAKAVKSYPDDLQSFTLTVKFDPSNPYFMQRVTVENLTLDMRWSADATDKADAVIANIIARSADKMRFIRNVRTYAVVAHLGYGIGLYDVNAIDSNRFKLLVPKNPDHIREQLVLTAGKIANECPNATPSYGIIENYLNTDAEMRGDSNTGNIYVYAPDPYRGVLDYRLRLPSPQQAGTRDDDCDQRSNPNYGGLLFRSTPQDNEAAVIKALRTAFIAASGREPYNHFTQVAQYHWSITAAQNAKGLRGTPKGSDADRDYLLIAGFDYGLVVVDINGNPPATTPWPLVNENIADVIWIPGGVAGVRVYQKANMAVANDRFGRVYLIDLSRIDERWDEKGAPTSGLFPTVQKSLLGTPTDPYSIGTDDPRIIWKSEPGVVTGTLAPVFDPNTGIIFAGAMAQRQVKVLSAIDPRLQVKVNLGEESGLSDVSGIVPLGIAPPKNIQDKINALPVCAGNELRCRENASLGVFRLELALPGNMLDSLTQSGNELQLAIESERIAGAITEQTPEGFPRAHLRRTRRDGSAESSNRVASNFKFKRIVPDELKGALRNQSGYNRFVSPWIVAIADPRASEQYDWSGATAQQKREAGCESCDRPKHLQGVGETAGVYELWTNGRYIAVRPELKASNTTIFDTTKYQYLGEVNRLFGRFSTVMADTVRPTDALVAGQNPPTASGMLQETVFLHSGEVQSSNADFNPGGRAGFDVIFDRTYRSRTIGGSVFGQGWDSSLFRRLRALPNGDVEYRDGAELWRFRPAEKGGYDSPIGLFLKLSRTGRGWKMIDQQWRVSEFDDLGRLLSESDEFFDPQTPNSGNIIRYVYDETGRLSQIIDPVQRSSMLTYWRESDAGQQGAYPGLVKQIADWRDRQIDYGYDAATGTLTKVQLPAVDNTTGSRPTLQYAYTPAGTASNDIVELSANLFSITDPQEVATGGAPRVKFTYETGGGFKRDHVTGQEWGTGETASFEYTSPTETKTTDGLGQIRKYELTAQAKNYVEDRAHVRSMVESAVPTSATPFGQLPALMTPTLPATNDVDRKSSFTYYPENGLVDTATLEGVRSTKFDTKDVRPEAPGFVILKTTTTPVGGSTEPITQEFTYQSGPNRSTFLAAVSANGKKIEAPEPSRANKTVQSVNDSISATETYDSSGLPRTSVSSGGTDPSGAGANSQIDYNPETDPAKHQRALPKAISEGDLETSVKYPTADQTVEKDARGIVTTTDFDAWQRPVHVSAVGPDMTLDESYQYDATGRLRKHVRKQGTVDVTTTYDYDVMGRRKSVSVDNIAAGGTTKTIATITTYDLKARTITTDHPGSSRTTVKLDTLGRTASSETTTGGIPIKDYFAYDLADNLVFRTDLLTASASAYDAHGRRTGVKAADGTEQITQYDAWGRPRAIRRFDTASAMFDESTFDFTDAGRLRSVSTKVDSEKRREINYAWDGGGRTTGMSESGRAAHSRFDTGGRMLSSKAGSGDVLNVDTTFAQTDVATHVGPLPQSVLNKEKSGSAYQLALEYNTAGDATTRTFGGLEWKEQFDQDGNVTSAKAPNRPVYAYDYDARGALKQETLPGGAVNKYNYHETGSLTSYKDPSDEVTETKTDLIGRPTERIYKDNTKEKIEWEGRRVKSITDRQGRLQTFNYNNNGQIETITGAGGVVLDRIAYDAAGRIIRWTNDDAVVEYSDFDSDGHPRRTTQSRYRNTVLVDQYTQEHTWNEHGERTSWTMPTYTGFASDKPWTKSVAQEYDAMGNIKRMQRTLNGQSASAFLDADYRNAGRPNQRKVITASGALIQRDYGYDGSTSQFNLMAVTANGSTVAGSSVIFDGLQKYKATLLGLSGGARRNQWEYDQRSRLQRTLLARDGSSTPQTEDVSIADFRNGSTRPSTTPVDPPSVVFREAPGGGHKIDKVERGLVVEQFTFTGGERTEDGKYVYQYDVKGRLTTVTDKSAVPPIRRVLYSYDGNNRLVGRRTEYATVVNPAASDWKLEDRPSILSADGLPAETTFVWDPVSDRLVSLFTAGASQNPTIDANGGLLRQIIHGGSGYDDPLEVTTVDVTASSGVGHLYPIYDEAGAGSLQVILNEQGQVVSRVVAAGPYGEDETVLLGSAVDKVSIKAKKGADGSLASVDISLRATEQIKDASLAGGVRLASVNAAGAAVRTSSKVSTIVDGATVQWTLNAAEWTALIDPSPAVVNGQSLTPAALSIAATSSLRAGAWSASLPFLPAPAWAVATKPVYTSAALPVEVRESLANLAQWLASIGTNEERTNTLYEVPNLLALGSSRLASGGAAQVSGDPQLLIVSSGFHAHPFQDPMTGKNYVRARWFDTQNGVWLTPDSAGYVDSPNLYSYAGADPVNGNDPTGNCDAANVRCNYWKTFFTVAGSNTVETVATVATLGGYQGWKEARENGELDQGKFSTTIAVAQGVQNFTFNLLTAGYYGSAKETVGKGGTFGDATKHWLGATTGATDLAQGYSDISKDDDYVLGGLRVLEGAGRAASLIVSGRAGYAKMRGQPLNAFGRNIGATQPGVTPKPPAHTLSDEQFVQRVATKAESTGTRLGHGAAGTGPAQGTWKHTYAKRVVRRYQRMTGQKLDLETEVSYLNGAPVPNGALGSARPDVFNPQTGELFDYKFVRNPGTGLTAAQRARNLRNVPGVRRQVEINP